MHRVVDSKASLAFGDGALPSTQVTLFGGKGGVGKSGGPRRRGFESFGRHFPQDLKFWLGVVSYFLEVHLSLYRCKNWYARYLNLQVHEYQRLCEQYLSIQWKPTGEGSVKEFIQYVCGI